MDHEDPTGEFDAAGWVAAAEDAAIDSGEAIGGGILAAPVIVVGGILGFSSPAGESPGALARLQQGFQTEAAGHKKGARPSTEEKHQKGDTRRKKDQERSTPPTPKPKNPSTYPPKTSPDYLRPGPKPKNKPPSPPPPPAPPPQPPKKDE